MKLTLTAALAGLATILAISAADLGSSPMTMVSTEPKAGPGDLDFLVGHWTVTNRRLKHRFTGSMEWDEFPSTVKTETILDGMGNLEQMTFSTRGTSGISLSLYDRERKHWSQYWAGSQDGVLLPAVVGRFSGDTAHLYGDDFDNGKPVKIHHTWTKISPSSVRWEQAFSADNGQTWETNWIMDWTRV